VTSAARDPSVTDWQIKSRHRDSGISSGSSSNSSKMWPRTCSSSTCGVALSGKDQCAPVDLFHYDRRARKNILSWILATHSPDELRMTAGKSFFMPGRLATGRQHELIIARQTDGDSCETGAGDQNTPNNANASCSSVFTRASTDATLRAQAVYANERKHCWGRCKCALENVGMENRTVKCRGRNC